MKTLQKTIAMAIAVTAMAAGSAHATTASADQALDGNKTPALTLFSDSLNETKTYDVYGNEVVELDAVADELRSRLNANESFLSRITRGALGS